MKRGTTIALALATALLYTLVLNSGKWRILTTRAPDNVDLQSESTDELHYFSLMREVADGHPSLGSSTMIEHRDSPDNFGYGMLPQGWLMRVTGWNLVTVVWIGDVVFPLLTALLLSAALAPLLSTMQRVLATIILMNVVGIGWLRSVNPQLTFLLIALYFLLFLSRDHDSRTNRIERGVLTGAMIFTHLHYALYFLGVEACDALYRLLSKRESVRAFMRRLSLYIVPVLFAVSLRAVQILQSADPLLKVDSYRRLGVIPSHLPAAPALQIKILLVLLCIWLVARSRKKRDGLWRVACLLLGGLIVLNQSVVHGVDAIFGVYYTDLVLLVCWLAVCVALVRLLPGAWQRTLALAILACISSFSFVREMMATNNTEPATGDTRDIFEWLNEQPGEHVVTAPMAIADLVPVLTRHYVTYNQYMRYQQATDRELAERYLLYDTLFPLSAAARGEGYPLAFGQYPGGLAARERTWCRLTAPFTGAKDCVVTAESLIVHQDLKKLLDEHQIDVGATLKKYGSDMIVTPAELPSELTNFCAERAAFKPYTIYECPSFRREKDGNPSVAQRHRLL